jgi:hypothetical protein
MSWVELSWVELSWVEFILQPVDQFNLVSCSPLGPMTRFYPYPFFSDNCFVVLPVGCPLWREDGSVTYSAIADLSDYWGPITIHYRLIWDCVPSSLPLTSRRDYGRGILSRLRTVQVEVKLRPTVGRPVRLGVGAHLGPVTNFSFSLKFSLDSCTFVIS